MQLFVFATLALALGTSLASPTPRHGLVRHEKRTNSGRMVKRFRANPAQELPVRIALAQNQLEVGHERLMDISDPRSPNFGKHLTSAEVGSLFRPSSESIDTVRSWLHGSGIEMDRHSVTPGKAYLKFHATIEELESLLSTRYHVYSHPTTNEGHIGCDEYHLPAGIARHIDFVTPSVSTISIGGAREIKKKKRSEVKSFSRASFPPIILSSGNSPVPDASSTEIPCHTAVTPDCLRGKDHLLPFSVVEPAPEIQTNTDFYSTLRDSDG